MRHRFRDTLLDGQGGIVGDIFSPKEKKDLAPGDEVEWLHTKKLDGKRGPVVVESVKPPYEIRLKSIPGRSVKSP